MPIHEKTEQDSHSDIRAAAQTRIDGSLMICLKRQENFFHLALWRSAVSAKRLLSLQLSQNSLKNRDLKEKAFASGYIAK